MNQTGLGSLLDPSSYSPSDGLTLIMAAIAIVVSLFALSHQKKELRLSALLEIFKFLSTQEQRELRGMIFDVYQYLYPEGIDKAANEGKAGKMVFDENYDIKSYIKRVESPFDQAGVLVKKGIVKPELFFDLYAEMVIRVWKVLEEDITNDRMRNPEVCKWFLELNKDATKYLQKKGVNAPLPFKRTRVLSDEKIKKLISVKTEEPSKVQDIEEEEKTRLRVRERYAEDKIKVNVNEDNNPTDTND